jgi:hypothetical protein
VCELVILQPRCCLLAISWPQTIPRIVEAETMFHYLKKGRHVQATFRVCEDITSQATIEVANNYAVTINIL